MWRTSAVAAIGCLAAAGCGDSRAPVPSLTSPASAGGYRTLQFGSAHVSISAPARWSVTAERRPLLSAITSGDAVIALWRYARAQPPPESSAELAEARTSLLHAIRARGRSVRVISSRAIRIDGRPAIELSALERIAGRPRRVLSTHLFTDGGEVVLEEYAPPAVFQTIRDPVFERVRSSLAITGGGS